MNYMNLLKANNINNNSLMNNNLMKNGLMNQFNMSMQNNGDDFYYQLGRLLGAAGSNMFGQNKNNAQQNGLSQNTIGNIQDEIADDEKVRELVALATQAKV